MHADTRQRLLDIAEQLFAERGFYGVSIAAIASEVGFTKQGLLHHFNTKEKLYGAILQRISDDFQDHQREALKASEDPLERLKKFYAALAEPTEINMQRTRLLMRELLDNNERAAKAENWYLRPFLDRLIWMVKDVNKSEKLSDAQALAYGYQLLGAVNYFLISTNTLKAVYGAKFIEAISTDFIKNLNRLINRGLNSVT
ncbi:MAG: TetR/AcrR family transcriptional regulator [Pseudomonadota bacterium]|nr:TetR/AcrR family transcriptional regulator [Pseudomonadota bacterium]